MSHSNVDDDQISEDNESKSYKSFTEEKVLDHDDPEIWAEAKALERRFWERIKSQQPNGSVIRTGSSTSISKELTDFKDPLKIRTLRDSEKEIEGVNPLSELFNPCKFLATVHANVEYLKIKVDGSKNLLSTQNQQTKELKNLVQENLEQFINCIDCISDSFVSDFKQKRRETSSYDEKMKDCYRKAKNLFHPLIERREVGERIRSSLLVISKLNLILSIPSCIKEEIARGEHKKVVNEYRKYKNYKKQFKSNSLVDRVFSEVNDLIENHRNFLFDQLKNPQISREEKERLIGYLYAFDAQPDPALFFLTIQQEGIIKSLENCMISDSIVLERVVKKKLLEKKMEEKWKDISEQNVSLETIRRTELELSEEVEKSVRGNSNVLKMIETLFLSSDEIPSIGGYILKLIEKLSRLLQTLIVDFWTFASNVLTGKYFKTKNRDNKENEIRKLSNNIQVCYEKIVRQAIKSLDNGRAHQDYLFKSVYTCVFVCSSLSEKLTDIPTGYLAILGKLSDEMKQWVIVETWHRTVKELKTMYIVDYEAGNPPGIVLPSLLRKHVKNTIKCVTPFLRQNDRFVSRCKDQFLECLRVFADCIHEVAFPEVLLESFEQEYSIKTKATLHMMGACYLMKTVEIQNLSSYFCKMIMDKEADLDSEDDDDDVGSDDERTSFRYSSHNVTTEKNSNLHLLMKSSQMKKIYQLYSVLEELVFNSYFQSRMLSFSNLIKRGILLGGYNWKMAPMPVEARTYIVEILLEISTLHFEMQRISQHHSQLALSKILELIGQLFLEYIRSIEEIGPNGALQLAIELKLIQIVLHDYETQRSNTVYSLLNDILDAYKQTTIESKSISRLQTGIIVETINKMSTQLSSFNVAEYFDKNEHLL